MKEYFIGKEISTKTGEPISPKKKQSTMEAIQLSQTYGLNS